MKPLKPRDEWKRHIFVAGLEQMKMRPGEVARSAEVTTRAVSRWAKGERAIPGPMWQLFRRWMFDRGYLTPPID